MRITSLLLLSLIFLTGCGFSLDATQPAATIPSPSATHASPTQPNPLSTASPVPGPTASVTSARACPVHGRLFEDRVEDGGSFGRDLPILVYLPPCHGHLDQEWPVIYLLHGLGGDYHFWPELGAVEVAESMARRSPHGGFLLVMPWQRTGLDFEAAFMDGLIPHVTSELGARTDSKGRVLAGISRGAGWGFRLGLRYPGTFSRLGLHSPALMSGDLFASERWLEGYRGDLPQLWIDIGEGDGLLPATVDLTHHLEDLGLVYEFHPGPGRHESSYWEQNLEAYFDWYAQDW